MQYSILISIMYNKDNNTYLEYLFLMGKGRRNG